MEPGPLLAKTTYLTPAERDLIVHAYQVAKLAHTGQLRLSGEPFLTHPVAVAELLADLGLDAPTIAAGLLHDAVEDSTVSHDQLVQQFSKEIANLVDGVTKIGKIHIQTDRQADAANIRKLLVAMASDVRVVLIKLADRLHNMRTIAAHPEVSRRRISRETREIYAPLAARLGIWNFKSELEDRAFAELEPEQYQSLAKLMKARQRRRGNLVETMVKSLQDLLLTAAIGGEVQGRYKNLYSIQKKMERQHKTLDQIYDQVAVRIIVAGVPDCYAVLGLVQTHFVPVESRFKDFIALPKENGYQSLHTTIKTPGSPLEVQIRTREMDARAGYGIAAHWQYKEGGHNRKDQVAWLQLLLAWQKELVDDKAFVDTVKAELFQEEVYVFTPRGEVQALKKGSTPLDFAYRVHTEVGHRCVGAKVNAKMVPLSYPLQNGDTVEILTQKNTGPSRDWLSLVATNSARDKIRLWFKNERREENISEGQEQIRAEMKRARLPISQETLFQEIAHDFHYKTAEDFYAAVGYGEISPKAAVIRLAAKLGPTKPELSPIPGRLLPPPPVSTSDLLVSGLQGVLTTLATCCNPVVGEPVVGYITRGKGVTIHRENCKNIARPEDLARLCVVHWQSSEGQKLPIPILIQARPRPFLVQDLQAAAAAAKIPFYDPRETADEFGQLTLRADVKVPNLAALVDLLQRFRSIKGVTQASRAS